jgi:hypothetical protein
VSLATRGNDLRIGDLDEGLPVAWHGVPTALQLPAEMRNLDLLILQSPVRK